MTLLTRISLRVSVVITLLVTVWAIVFYFAITDEINDETDDTLEDYAEILIEKALSGETLPSADNGTNNQYFIEQISPAKALASSPICYGDTTINLAYKRENEPARYYSAIFKDRRGDYYNLRVFTPTFEREDLIQSILTQIIILYSSLLLAIIGVNVGVFYRSMKPFYRLIKWLDAYQPGVKQEALVNVTDITEFQKLNEAAINYTRKMEESFEKQKEFIGNASHEIQTPLALCRNRIEMLLENENLTEQQAIQLSGVYQILKQIGKLNKTLLLLSKIDNAQFPDKSLVSFNALIARFLPDYEEVYDYKHIATKVIQEDVFTHRMNETLAEILLTNFLRNAFVHSPENGSIAIRITEKEISFSNNGVFALEQPERIFERFYQGNSKEGSSGLGLAIVAAICRQEGLTVNYTFHDGNHQFRIRKA